MTGSDCPSEDLASAIGPSFMIGPSDVRTPAEPYAELAVDTARSPKRHSLNSCHKCCEWMDNINQAYVKTRFFSRTHGMDGALKSQLISDGSEIVVHFGPEFNHRRLFARSPSDFGGPLLLC